MPNHYTVVGLGRGDVDFLEEKTGCGSYEESDLKTINLCQAVMPRPEVFNNIVSSSRMYRYKNTNTGDYYPDVNGPIEDRGGWEIEYLTAEELKSLQLEYGATSWFRWCSDNWGTKWGTYDLKVRELGGDGQPILIEFQSAWSPPNSRVMSLINTWLADNYGINDIYWIGYDPYNEKVKPVPVAALDSAIKQV